MGTGKTVLLVSLMALKSQGDTKRTVFPVPLAAGIKND